MHPVNLEILELMYNFQKMNANMHTHGHTHCYIQYLLKWIVLPSSVICRHGVNLKWPEMNLRLQPVVV